VDVTGANSNKPGLCIGEAGEEAIASGKLVVGKFELTGVDVDGNKLAFVRRFDLRSNLLLVDLIAASREFLLCISWLTSNHGNPR
jgi:hypothetical protein